MTRELFYKLYHDAKDQPDLKMYIAEYGYPDYFDEIADSPDEVVAKLTEIHRLVNMSLRDVIESSGMSQTEFAKFFDIPRRTVQNWAGKQNTCPEYVKVMMLELLDLLPDLD